MEYRYALVTSDDCHQISMKLFKTFQEAWGEMKDKIKSILVDRRYSEEEFEKDCENGTSDDFGIYDNYAWVSVPTFGWIDMQIFDLTSCKRED